jgi:hypothetical protein
MTNRACGASSSSTQDSLRLSWNCNESACEGSTSNNFTVNSGPDQTTENLPHGLVSQLNCSSFLLIGIGISLIPDIKVLHVSISQAPLNTLRRRDISGVVIHQLVQFLCRELVIAVSSIVSLDSPEVV